MQNGTPSASLITLRRAALSLAALLLLAAAAAAIPYTLDSGVVSGGISVPGYKYANRFVITPDIGQTLDNIQIKRPEDPDPAGTCDVYLWAANATGTLPGAVLASRTGVSIPQGPGWTTVDFTSSHIQLAPGTIVFAGIVSTNLYAYFDDSGVTQSYRQTPGNAWAKYGSGYLMVRMETYTDPTPTLPATLTVTPMNATVGDMLRATASGSLSGDTSATITYEYQWAQSVNGAPFGDFTVTTATVPASRMVIGDRWKARARGKLATGEVGPWIESAPIWIRPLIFRSMPEADQTNAQRRGYLQINFRWPMVQDTVEANFTCTPAGGSPVPGTFTWTKIGLILRFQPDRALDQNTVYTIKLARGVVRRGPLRVNVDTTYCFTTGGQPIPIVWNPQGQSVPVTTKIVVAFDKPIGASSVNAETFRVTPETAGTYSVVDNKIFFSPTRPLRPATRYFIGLSGQIATPTGRIMGRSFSWNFTTAATAGLMMTAAAVPTASGATQITVNLTSAANVAVEITNIAGKVIATLPARDLPSGVSTLLWDGKSHTGAKVPAGRYFTRLTASNPTGATTHCQAAFQRR